VLLVVVACVLPRTTNADTKLNQIPILIRSLNDANVRYGAAVALSKLGDKAVSALRESLQSSAADVPVWAAYTLGRIGPAAKSAVPDLIKALASSDEALRGSAAQALGQIGLAAATAVGPLAKTLNDAGPEVRLRAVVALGKIGPPAKNAIGQIVRKLADRQLRKRARQALIRIRPSVEYLLKLRDDESIRFDVGIVLAKVDPQSAKKANVNRATAADLPALRLVFDDPTREPWERTRAANSLAGLGRKGTAVLLSGFEKQWLAPTAAAAFGRNGAKSVRELLKKLDDPQPLVRWTAIDAIGHIGPAASDATPQLIHLLSDKHREVRYRAVLALHAFKQKAAPAVPRLIKVINNKREAERTRQWAIKTLLVTLPATKTVVVKALIATAKVKGNYGVSQLARQQVRKIDLKAAIAAGLK